MKTLLSSVIGILSILLQGCSEQSNESNMPEVKWHEAQYSLQKYTEMQPDRPILAVFTADWSLMTALQRKILEEGTSREILRSSGYLCLWYDMTEYEESSGHADMKRLGLRSLPYAVIINGPEGGERPYELSSTKEEDLHDFLRSIRTTKYAEQVAASDR